MGEYIRLSKIESLREPEPEPFEYDKNIKKFFKWSNIVGSGMESSPISHVAFSPTGSICAISAGTKVMFYDYLSQQMDMTFTSAKDFVRCSSFRRDSKLAAVSDDSGVVSLIALPLRSVLRRFDAHKSAVHSHDFAFDKLHFMTGGDDATAKYWDTLQMECISTLSGHKDRVRSLCNVSMDSPLWVTGCYDCTARLFDIRCASEPVAIIQHGFPIESVSCSDSGMLLVTAGGTTVKIWDVSSGLRLKDSFQPHTRTTIMAHHCEKSNCTVTASLDGSVRYTNEELTLRHAYRFYSPISSCAVSKDEQGLAVGLYTGEWSIRYNNKQENTEKTKKLQLLTQSAEPQTNTEGNVTAVHGHRPAKLTILDRLIKTFQYQAALDLAIKLTPTHVYNLVETLILRGALGTAVRGRDEKTIIPLINFVATHLNREVAHTNTLLELLHAIIDNNTWLERCDDAAVLSELRKIPNRINFELHQHSILLTLKGTLDLILARPFDDEM